MNFYKTLNRLNTGLPTTNTRIESLDFLRGIAACSVMLFHYTAVTSIHLLDENPLRIVGGYGHFGVEVFFVLSGFVIPYSMYLSSYKINLIGKFLLKRTIRIEMPFLVLIGIEVILIYVSSLTPWKNGPSERLNVADIVLHVGYLNGVVGRPWLIPVFWTLAIEFQFYILMALLFPLFSSTKLSTRMLALVGIAALGFIVPQQYLFFNYALFFLTGILAFHVMVGLIKSLEFYLLFAAILCLLYIQRESLSMLLVAITLVVILFFNFNWKWSSFLGMISYSIYLIHVPFGGRLLVLTQMFIKPEGIKSLLILIYLGATIFVAWFFYLLVEKPSLRLANRIRYKNSTLK